MAPCGIARLVRNKACVAKNGWGVVDYKDWPLLDWGWVKELCAVGVETAAATGQWVCLATSNFCGPQFVGMWRDVAWHRAQTERIHRAQAPAMSSAGWLSPGRAEDGAAPH
jgi:hypothetical protein